MAQPAHPDIEAVDAYFVDLQARIVAALEALDGRQFLTDRWTRTEGGGGVTRVLEEGQLFERGGVNFSRVSGKRLPPSASAARPGLSGRSFDAMGVSLVLHPRNPYCPTAHMNVRFFVAHAPDGSTGSPFLAPPDPEYQGLLHTAPLPTPAARDVGHDQWW